MFFILLTDKCGNIVNIDICSFRFYMRGFEYKLHEKVIQRR
jgi:hypothetical protein